MVGKARSPSTGQMAKPCQGRAGNPFRSCPSPQEHRPLPARETHGQSRTLLKGQGPIVQDRAPRHPIPAGRSPFHKFQPFH